MKYWRVLAKKRPYWVLDDGTGPYLVKDDLGQTYRDPLKKTDQIARQTDPLADINTFFGGSADIAPCRLLAGQYHPRICRFNSRPSTDDVYDHPWSDSVKAVRAILTRLEQAFQVVEPDSRNAAVFGHELRQILILACTEVESACRAILRANGYQPPSNGMWKTSDYAKLAGPLYLADWEVGLTRSPRYPRFAPFRGWNASSPTQSLDWYNAYNATKHDRENHLSDATLERAIRSSAAAFVLVYAQFGQFGIQSFSFTEVDTFHIAEIPTYRLEDHYVPPHAMPGAQWNPIPYHF